MFDSIAIRRQARGDEQSFDLGFLVETMLFYDQVHLIADRGMLQYLLRFCSPEILLELVEEEFLTFTYLENDIGMRSQSNDVGIEVYDAVTIGNQNFAVDRFIPNMFIDSIGKPGKGRRLARRFIDLINTDSYDRIITTSTLEDIHNHEYIKRAVPIILKSLVPQYNQRNIFFNIYSENETKVSVETNIDFKLANQIYHKTTSPQHSTLDIRYLLSYLTMVQGDLYLASSYSTDIATDDINSQLIKLKIDGMFRRQNQDDDQIGRFQDFAFNDSRAIREAVNSGERSFKEVLDLLSSAKKFRGWLKGQEPNQDIIKAYFQEVTKSNWVDKLPGKSSKWVFFLGIGASIDAMGLGGVGTGLAVGASILDTFFFDKMVKGWKPNQFIETQLATFVTKEKKKL